jgi:transcriptional regulator with XRE-family HTH domain
MSKIYNQRRPKRSTEFDEQLGLRVRQARKKMKMSQEQLGKTVGVSFQQMQKYENGSNRISASRLVQIARALQSPINFFLDASEPPATRTRGEVRQEFNEAMRHLNVVGESLGLAVRIERAAAA